MSSYLVKSIKWTKNDGIEKWWGPNESGYTAYIYQAGVYTEEQAEGIVLRTGVNVAKAVLIDRKIMEKGLNQLVEMRASYRKERDHYIEQAERCSKRMNETVEKTTEYINKMGEIEGAL